MKRRNCCDVIFQMLEIIPDDNNELIKDLQWNYDDACYKAPEDNIQWIRTQETLEKHIPKPINDWEFNVLSIFTTIPINELKNIINNEKN